LGRRATLVAVLALAACGTDEQAARLAAGQAAKQRGYQALQQQDYGAAEAAYRQAAANLPHDAYVELNLGVAEEHLGKLDAARDAYRLAIVDGKGVAPVDVTDPNYAGRTVAQLAEADLAGMAPAKPSAK
jgi:Tfp pilus assembly protein PilF